MTDDRCTDCDDTGITIQTERRCACQPPRIQPTPADIDNIHHALGRPKRSWMTTHRNYFCTAVDGELATRFRALGLWDLSHTINGGRDGIFTVNTAGKVALAEAMKAGWKAYDK